MSFVSYSETANKVLAAAPGEVDELTRAAAKALDLLNTLEIHGVFGLVLRHSEGNFPHECMGQLAAALDRAMPEPDAQERRNKFAAKLRAVKPDHDADAAEVGRAAAEALTTLADHVEHDPAFRIGGILPYRLARLAELLTPPTPVTRPGTHEGTPRT